MTTAKIHPFQAAGFGPAPYRVIGYSTEKYQAAPGAPIQAGSSCDYCGQSIMHVYWIQSANGTKFKVGSDCVAKTDPDLHRYARRYRMDVESREKRKAWVEAARQERIRTALPALGKIARKHFERYAEEQVARWIQERAQYIGQVGERKLLRLRLDAIIPIDGFYGTSYLHKFTDPETGAQLVWFGSHRLRMKDKWTTNAKKGALYYVKGTVKSHEPYRGVKQTNLARVEMVPKPRVKKKAARRKKSR